MPQNPPITLNKEEKYILAVDHGTSSVKTALISVYGKILGYEFEETPVYLFEKGGAEQDPDEWFNAFLAAGKKLIGRNLVDTEDIVGICVSGQWACTVPVDRKGDHLMNAISWMDSRGAPYVKKVCGGLINISGYGITNLMKWLPRTGGGPGLSGKGPIGHILYIKNEHPEVYKKTYKFLEAKDYMNLRLTDKFSASYDGNFLHWVINSRDLGNMFYDDKLINALRIDRDKLPQLIKSTDIVGHIKRDLALELGINEYTKVFSGSGDLHMAAVGSGSVKNYQGHIYLGTSSWILVHVPFKKTDVFHNIVSIPSADPSKYLVVNEQDSAGNCLTYLRDKILAFDPQGDRFFSYRELDIIAEKVAPGSDNLIFTPWLFGERTPIEDHTVRGGFHNINFQHNIFHYIRAVFEGVAFNTRWVLRYVEKFVKRKLNPLNIIGGGAVSDVWCQIYADILGRTIRRVINPVLANARGAAFIASVGLGYLKFDDIPNYIEFTKIFDPNPENRVLYDNLFEIFVDIYKKNRKIYRKMNL